MRAIAASLALASLIATPAHAERFAISCSGTSTNTIRMAGRPDSTSTSKARNVIFVIDEEGRTVERLSFDKTKFDEVCPPELNCSRDFSPARIRVAGERSRTSTGEAGSMEVRRVVSFDWDRQTNTLETVHDLHATRGVTVLLHASHKCARTKTPAGYVPRTSIG